MTEGVATQASGRGLMIAVWVVSGLLTALFLFAGIPKLMGNQQAVEGFRGMGYPDAFRLFIGAAEVSGAIGLWIPRLAFWAAIGLAIIMVGAVYTHIRFPAAGPPTNAGIALVMLLFVAWARRRNALILS
jgi:putative oxidoreductase